MTHRGPCQPRPLCDSVSFRCPKTMRGGPSKDWRKRGPLLTHGAAAAQSRLARLVRTRGDVSQQVTGRLQPPLLKHDFYGCFWTVNLRLPWLAPFGGKHPAPASFDALRARAAVRHSWMGLAPRNAPTVRKRVAKAEPQDLGFSCVLLKGRAVSRPVGQGPFLRPDTPRGSHSASDEGVRHRADGGGCWRLGDPEPITESQSGRGWQGPLWVTQPNPCPSRVTQSRLHSTAARRGWNISREGDSTASLGSLGQGSVTLRGKKRGVLAYCLTASCYRQLHTLPS